MATRHRGQAQSVVVALTTPAHAVRRECVPLLARHFTRLAADAQRRIGEETHRLRVGRSRHNCETSEHIHAVLPSGCAWSGVPGIGLCAGRGATDSLGWTARESRRPRRMLQTKAFASWMLTFTSVTIGVRS